MKLTFSKKLLMISACLLLAAGAIVLSTPKEAEAIGALAFRWSCEPPDGVCTFNVTTNNHAVYYWGFGDGTTYGPTTSKSVQHDYNFSGSEQSYDVALVGYATNPPSSPDNIVGCTVAAQGPAPGGHPGAGDDCP